ncbi:fumarylacetoacetate hydrolase family protein [bacterium]|nr:fumarylacetoacetate hydrolase family protein [bacterium]
MPAASSVDPPFTDAEALARLLHEAEAKRQLILPLTERLPALTPREAYGIQQALVERSQAEGARLVGYKLGFTSLAKQAAMGVYEPIYGTLLEGMQGVDGGSLPLDRFIHPRVEPEVAFVMGRDLSGPAVTEQDVRAATASLHPALDVIDSRYEAFRFQLPDVIADNASGAAFVLGPAIASFQDLDLAALEVAFYQNGRRVSQGTGKDVMGSPAQAVAWLARALHAQGRILPAGAVVLSGALVAPLAVSAGDAFEARFGSLGNVSLTFAPQEA